MKRNPILLLLVIVLLFSLIACQNVKQEKTSQAKAPAAAKKVVKSNTVDNPLKNAQVGEYVDFKMITESMGTKTEMQMKQSVVAKDEVSVTLRTETTAMGQKMPPQDAKIMLNQPYEPYKAGYTDAVVTPLGEGDETITAGGKSYDCHWAKVKVVATNPTAVESVTTVWSCKDIPVNGMAKMTSDSTMKMGAQTMNTKMTMELVSAGKQ